MPAVLETKSKPLSFAHVDKQKAYQFLVENPTLDYASYRIMIEDPSLDEKSFDEVARAIRVSADSEFDTSAEPPPKINPDIFFVKKEPAKQITKKIQGEHAMAKEATVTEAPKKRGRPPGSKKAATVEKVKGKRGRPAKPGVKSKSPKPKTSGKGVRYSVEKQQEIVSFVRSQGHGGLTRASKKYGVSYPTLARWVKQAGIGKRSSKVEKRKVGRPKKTEAVPAGHVVISKKMIKEFRKGVANLEAAFGAFSNALRVLE